MLGARSLTDARRGALFAGLLKLPVLFIMLIPGVLATLILPPLDHGDQVFPALIGELLSTGVRGLVLAALVAALMSSIDSTLNSASALLTLDFIKPSRPELTPRQLAWIGRVAILLFMLISAAIAPLIGSFEGLVHYLQTVLAYLVPPVAALFLVGSLWRRPGPGAALATLIGGHSLSITLFALSQIGLLNLHFTLIAGLIFWASLSDPGAHGPHGTTLRARTAQRMDGGAGTTGRRKSRNPGGKTIARKRSCCYWRLRHRYGAFASRQPGQARINPPENMALSGLSTGKQEGHCPGQVGGAKP